MSEPPAARRGVRVLVLAGLLMTGVAADASVAALEARAVAGDALAARVLGTAYYAGFGVDTDHAAAVAWWRAAAAAGDTTAAYNAGLVLLATDPGTARSLLEQAAVAGDALAAYVLGTILARSAEARAAYWLEQAARAGYAPAQFNLARHYEQAATPDPTRARHWYAAAAASFAPAAARLAALDGAAGEIPPPAAAESAPSPTDAAGGGTRHGRDWVLAQAADHYTVQVAVGRDATLLHALLDRHAAAYDTAVFEHRPGAREPYSALVGAYTTPAAAARALAELPAPLRRQAPWVRAFGTVQRELAAAASAAP